MVAGWNKEREDVATVNPRDETARPTRTERHVLDNAGQIVSYGELQEAIRKRRVGFQNRNHHDQPCLRTVAVIN